MGKRYTCNNGDKFDLWTVIDNTIIVKNTRRYVKVKCVCGTEKLLALCDLKNGRTSGCSSCMARKRSRNIKIGDKFKDWTIIGGPISDSHQCLLWEIQQANLSKHVMTMNELYEFCKKVLNHANQQPNTPLTKCEGSETNS